jgi:hypothetical protein
VFGDTYQSGHKLVTKIIYPKWYQGKQINWGIKKGIKMLDITKDNNKYKIQFELPEFILKIISPIINESYYEFYIGKWCFNYDECGIVTIDNYNNDSDFWN